MGKEAAGAVTGDTIAVSVNTTCWLVGRGAYEESTRAPQTRHSCVHGQERRAGSGGCSQGFMCGKGCGTGHNCALYQSQATERISADKDGRTLCR